MGMTEAVCVDLLNTLAPCLAAGGWNLGIAEFVSILLGVVLVATFPLLVTVLLIWVERKVAARLQDRLGPNRVGPFGLLQPLADVIKLIGKEDITPNGADKLIYNLAPPFMVGSVLLIWAVVPFTPYHYGVDLDIGVLYFITVASISTLAVMMAGWASNNKYALLGAFRVVAQLISYEVPLALALLIPVMLAGTMSMVGVVEAQAGMWFMLFSGGWQGPFVYQAPLLGLVYLLAKASFWYFLALWLRNSLPRLRIDQMMAFNWKFLVPLSIVNVLVTAFLLRVVQELGLAPQNPSDFIQNIPQTLVLLLGNGLIVLGTLAILRNQGRLAREADTAQQTRLPAAAGD
jgi:NADH:ubiquinone oxidoreductase subunit H